MSIERAYQEIDRRLRENGVGPMNYVLWDARRTDQAVIDFAVPLNNPKREQVLEAIEAVLIRERGRDRVSVYAMELARFALERERRSTAA